MHVNDSIVLYLWSTLVGSLDNYLASLAVSIKWCARPFVVASWSVPDATSLFDHVPLPDPCVIPSVHIFATTQETCQPWQNLIKVRYSGVLLIFTLPNNTHPWKYHYNVALVAECFISDSWLTTVKAEWLFVVNEKQSAWLKRNSKSN